MAMKDRATAKYRVIADSGGSCYRFFCDASGMVLCTTKPICGNTHEEELYTAWEAEGKQHFNRCTKCGKWVSDPMYNADLLQCVDCAPWQEKPNYCFHCGRKVSPEENFCNNCGVRLRYGEVVG